MSVAPSVFPAHTRTPAIPGRRGSRWPLAVAWALLALLLIVQMPAFLCMGLDCDASLYDLIARRVLAGDVHYRDLFDVNFPGIVWLHMLVRSLFGWTSEALRAVDIAIIGCSVWLLTRLLPRSTPAWGRVATAGLLLTFYLSTTEWCHCQRDPWMLLPCLVALRLRGRQSDRMALGDSSGLFRRGLLEGIVWGSAIWIKPYAMVPALACWIVSARIASRTPGCRKRLVLDLVGLLAGGLLVGALGVAWLVATGAWTDFVDIMFRWNAEYRSYSPVRGPWWVAPLGVFLRQFPWSVLHFAAVPMAVGSIWNVGRRAVSPLLAAFYLAWLFQAVVLQHYWDYVHIAPVLLAVTVLACNAAEPRGRRSYRSFLPLVACAVWSTVLMFSQVSVSNWTRCVTEGSDSETKERVGRLGRIDWNEKDRVTAFLKEQNVGAAEVCVLSMPLVSIYNDLGVRPANRFCFLNQHLIAFESRRESILSSLASSRQRFLVCDLKRRDDRLREDIESGRAEPPCCRTDRIVFRAGDYVVIRVDGREMPAWLNAFLPSGK